MYLGDTPRPLPKGLRPSELPFFSTLLEQALRIKPPLTIRGRVAGMVSGGGIKD
ncbi:MAG TPA: hypothetical protein VFR55_13880 [Dehalococcoidia bacterium]|nr:hypothetical protein [Dehalococcoidia bacterium]